MADLYQLLGILIATLGGAAVGLERQWSGHATGPRAHFAGIRTFTLLGLAAGLSGWLWTNGMHVFGATLLAAAAALVVAAYFAVSRVEVDGTTEVAALVVLAAGALAGMQQLKLASAVIGVTALLLVEKSRLHAMVARIDDASLRAGIRFAVMAVVILPLLPAGPYGPLGGIRPRQLWALVLFFSGLSFAGYIARRIAGARRGYSIAGILGGIVSSTNVAFTFARLSRSDADSGQSLALGVIGACAVMYVRVLVSTAVLNAAVVLPLLLYFAAPFLAAGLFSLWGARKYHDTATPEKAPANPLQFPAALQMAVLFQIVLFVVRWAQGAWGQTGVLVSAGVFGLTDMDALVVSMAKDAAGRLAPAVIAEAIAVGALSNTLLKLAIGVAFGRARFRRFVAAGLAVVAVVSAVSLAWLR